MFEKGEQRGDLVGAIGVVYIERLDAAFSMDCDRIADRIHGDRWCRTRVCPGSSECRGARLCRGARTCVQLLLRGGQQGLQLLQVIGRHRPAFELAAAVQAHESAVTAIDHATNLR